MQILAITAMRNEGPHCLEWFAHHLAAGVGHFLVCSNDCDDGTDDMLDLLAGAGLVSHERLQPGARPVQWQALKHASGHQRLVGADWVLGIDCDEFINLRAPLATLGDLVEALPNDADAVALRWRLFGSGGQVAMQDGLTIERFERAAPVDISLPLAHFFKTLFRPAAFARRLGVHRPKRKKDSVPVWVDGSGQPLPPDFGARDNRINLYGIPAACDLVQLNHYSLRAAENFMVKRARGLPNHTKREIGLGYWVERNFNDVQDSSIRRMVPATRARLAELLEIPGLAELHARAWVAQKEKFGLMMAGRDEAQLFWRLILSGSSAPPTPEMARDHVRRINRS